MSCEKPIHVHVHPASGEGELFRMLAHLLSIGERLMSKFSEYADKQEQFNNRMHTAISDVEASVSGLSGDVTELNRQIQDLRDNMHNPSPEDQARLDALVASGEAVVSKFEAASQALKDLDAMTPPAIPSDPGTGGGDTGGGDTGAAAGPGPGDQTVSPDTRGT